MATTGIINGTSLLVYVDGTALMHSTSGTLTLNMDTRDATTKESGGWKDVLEAGRNWSIEAEGMYALDSSNKDWQDLFSAMNTRSTVALQFKTSDAADKYYSGSAYVTSISQEAPTEDSTSYSVSFEGTGTLAENN
tara:strand:+ start:12 stop:419 length:408 start_codon:yes stop_codon:yes gene_type:complete